MPTTAPENLDRGWRAHRAGGFTFIELLVSMFLGAIILAAVLTVFLMIGKVQNNGASYVEMSRDAQNALERFGQDTRMAISVETQSATEIWLTIPEIVGNSIDKFRFHYDPATKQFRREELDPATNTPIANTLIVLARNVESCAFKPFKLASLGAATSDFETDLLQIQMIMRKSRNTTVTTSDLVVSASYLLRNHKNT